MSTAKEKLEQSQLQIGQMQGLAEDVDLDRFFIVMKNKIGVNIVERIMDATIERTMEGASTLEVRIDDTDRSVLHSGRLSSRCDVEVDGLWFRLMGVEKEDNDIVLTFEEREIALLREYDDRKVAGNKLYNRAGTTRAEFVKLMLSEVKEQKLRYYIPELHVIQPIEDPEIEATYGLDKSVEREPGLAPEPVTGNHHGVPEGPKKVTRPSGRLTVKGALADKEQLANANIILKVGTEMKMPRRVLVAAIMTAIQESEIRNLRGGHLDSVGLFQQRANGAWGTYADRHTPAIAARMFYKEAIKAHNNDPTRPLWDLCQTVQRSAYPTAYDQWKVEGERFVSEFGVPGTSTSAANAQVEPLNTVAAEYMFYRGVPPTRGGKKWEPEDSWTCIKRLADEVNFRAFVVTGVVYFISEERLLKSKPKMKISETSDGVDSINFHYVQNTRQAEVTVNARLKRWQAPPGSVVELFNCGPINGRWLVASIRRSIYDNDAVVSLKKARPILPEPLESSLSEEGWTGAPTTTRDVDYSGRFVLPLDTPLPTSTTFNQADGPEGIPGPVGFRHGALDWFAPAGSHIKAPTDGEIFRITPPEDVKATSSNPNQVFGGVVGFRELGTGYVWIFRHVTPSMVYREGARMKAGDVIAAVYRWSDNPASSHAHIEIFRPGTYPDRNMSNMVDPLEYINGKAV